MRNICIVLFCFLILVGCGKSENTQGVTRYSGQDFLIQIPASWELISKENASIPDPNRGEVVLAARAKDFYKGIKNNILILKDELPRFSTSQDFSLTQHIGSIKTYKNYQKLSSKSLLFQDEEKSIVYIFEARYTDTTPKIKFLQTGRICNQKESFLITIGISPDIHETTQYENLLSSFVCGNNK